MVVVESAAKTDIGLKRKINEDQFLLDDEMKLYVVADGMGGHQAGEIASDLVIRTLKDYMIRFGKGDEVEELEDPDKTLSKDANRLVAGMMLANQVVYQAATQNTAYNGMGSTVSAISFTHDTLIAANVGDSPIYLIRGGTIEEISVPHTVMAEHRAMGGTSETQLSLEYSHMLTRAMGVEESVRADACEFPCFAGDVLVIASDGLTNKVTPTENMEIATTKRPEKSCKILTDMANDRGGDDNITLIVIKVKSVKRRRRGIFDLVSSIFGFGRR